MATHKLLEPTPYIGLDELVARREAWFELSRFLAGLKLEQRRVFMFVDLLGMRMPEVATLVEAPLDTLYSRIRSARRSFRQRFANEGRAHLDQNT